MTEWKESSSSTAFGNSIYASWMVEAWTTFPNEEDRDVCRKAIDQQLISIVELSHKSGINIFDELSEEYFQVKDCSGKSSNFGNPVFFNKSSYRVGTLFLGALHRAKYGGIGHFRYIQVRLVALFRMIRVIVLGRLRRLAFLLGKARQFICFHYNRQVRNTGPCKSNIRLEESESAPKVEDEFEHADLLLVCFKHWSILWLKIALSYNFFRIKYSGFRRVGCKGTLRRENWPRVTQTLRCFFASRAQDQSVVLCIEDAEAVQDLIVGAVGAFEKSDRVLLPAMYGSSLMPGWARAGVTAEGWQVYAEPPAQLLRAYVPPKPEGGWPKISLITVSYNQRAYIESCLESVMAQGYPNLEYIVIDGNSDDGTLEILERFRHRITKLVIEPDEGQSDALNKGFSIATGEILSWLCSDDMLEENALFHIARAFSDNNVNIVAGGCKVINSDGEVKTIHHSAFPINEMSELQFLDVIDFTRNWQAGDFFYQPEVFFTKEIWQKSGGYIRDDLFYAMDYEMFLRMAMVRAQILHIPRVLAASRQHEQQKTQHSTMSYLPQIYKIFREFIWSLEMVEATTAFDNNGLRYTNQGV